MTTINVRAVTLMNRFRILVVVVVGGLRVQSVTPISETGSIFRPPQAYSERPSETYFCLTSFFNPPAAGNNDTACFLYNACHRLTFEGALVGQ